MAKDPSIQYLNKDFLKSKKVVIFDIETQELALSRNKISGSLVGVANKKNAVSFAAARIYEGGKVTSAVYNESEIYKLVNVLKNADIVSGYNIRGFDLEVLSNYAREDLRKLPNVVDMIEAIQGKLGRRPKLNDILKGTLGISKPQTGSLAVEQWKTGRHKELISYVQSDVAQEAQLFEHIVEKGWFRAKSKTSRHRSGNRGKTRSLRLELPSEQNKFYPHKPGRRYSRGKNGGGLPPVAKLAGGRPLGAQNNLRWLRAGLDDIDKLGLSRNSISTNLWNAFKGFEETWGGFGRTFELSPLTSMLSLRKAEIHIGSDDLRAFQNYYSKLVGRTLLEKDFEKGLTFKAGSLFIGKDKVAGKFGAIQRYWKHPVEGHLGFHSRIAQSFQSALGIRPVGLNDPNRPSDFTSDARYLIYGGTKTNLGLAAKRAQAIGATLSKRYFKLLDDPLEFYSELFNTDLGSKLQGRSKFASNFYNKILRNRLGVGGKANELGGIGRLWLRHGGQLAKYIIGGSFLYHLVDNFAEDTLGFGIKEVGAKLYQGANLALSTLSYVTGLTAVRRIQEKYAPGSTDKGAYLAFPLSGAITGAFIAGMKNNIALTTKGPDALKSVYAREAIKGLPTKIPIIRNLIKGKQYTRVGRYGILGATIGALVAAPFLAGTVGHKYTPGELMDLYSGREEVAVRKSRFWEAGRCILPNSKIFTELNGYKLACEITTEDRLLTPNGFSNIIEIYQRRYNGEAIALYSAANRYMPTFVTPNHIIPSIKFVSSKIYTRQNHLEIREREAGELKVHDYVQIPIEKMDESLVEIDILDYLNQDTLILENNLVYCGQKNRFTDKIHKTKSLPLRRYIKLDEDLGWLFGVFAAEGNISFGYSKPDRIRRPQFIETVHSIHELWIAEKIQFICEQKFGIEAKIRYRNNFTKAKEGAYIVRICNSLLARLFYGLLYDEIFEDYDKSFTKLLKGPTVFKLALVQGYWDGDGHLDGEAKIISSARENLVLESQQILFNYGIFSSLSLETRDIGNENQSKKFKLRWVKNIPFEDGPRYFWDNGNLWAEIVTIESLEFSGLVYDFEVEDESHLLQAGSFFIHNSPMRGGQIDYFRPHFSVTAQIRAQEKSLFDKGENFLFRAIKQTEILKDIVAPYYMEESHYGDRPYPIAVGKSYGLGPLSAVYNMTLAKLFKPPRYMHMAEWASEDGTLWGSETEKASARAVVDYSKQVTSLPSGLLAESEDLAQRLSDAFGLVGFMGEAINENLTGRRVWLQQMIMLQPSSDMNSLQKSFWDLNIGGGLGTCFRAGTLIKTQNGTKPIEDIQIGELILNPEGYFPVRDKLTQTGTEFLKISTSGIHTSFECTPNHWIPVVRRHTYQKGHLKPFNEKNFDILEIQAKDVRVGDRLFYAIDRTEKELIIDFAEFGKSYTKDWVYYQASLDFANAYESLELNPSLTRKDLRDQGIPDKIGKEALRQFRKNQTPKRIRRFAKVDNDLAWFFGWYLAEGSTSPGKINFTMNANEMDYAKELARIGKEKFLAESSIKLKNNTLRLAVYSSALSLYVRTFGKNAREKYIPIEYKQLENSKLFSFIESLILGDGFGILGENYGFTSSSSQLVKDVTDCLLKLGLSCNNYLNYIENPSGNYPQGTLRKATVRSYLRSTKGESVEFLNGCRLLKVASIDLLKTEEESIYDLTIDQLHYYTADGVVVHNTEALRRLIPPKRAQNRYINNIPNEMPSWIPQRHYLDLHHGDPFGKIPEGELRLPGKGFEARYPELAGLSPEDYPLAYRVKVLSDIAPFSAEFQALSKQGEMYASEMTGREKHVFSQAIKQAQQKKNERMFAEDPTNIYSWYFQTINYLGRLNPIEHLLPISPVHKFGGPVGAIEDYKLNMIYSKEFTSWAHPIESFIKPAMRVAAHDLGWQGIPGDIQDRREIQEYFDRLEYLQMMTLANRSEDGRTALSYSLAANKTLTGVNPFGPESTIYQALEGREEYYYAPFRDEMNPRRQAEILQYLPEQYKKIYRAIWTKRKAESGNKKAQKELALLLQSEGEDINEDLIAQYKASAHSRSLEGYADWKRMRDTQQFLAEHDFPVPPPNWAGFHRGVKMNDVKMRYVQNAGCLLGHSLVATNFLEFCPIAEIKEGNFVLNCNGEQSLVKKKFVSDYTGRVRKIRSIGTPFLDLELTEDHHLPYKNRQQEFRYGQAKDLRKWFSLGFPSWEFPEDLTELDLKPYISKSCLTYRWPEKVEITDELAEVLGWWLAEGSIREDREVRFTLSMDEAYEAQFICNVLKESFGGKPSVKPIPEKGCINITFCCSPLAKLLIVLFGKGALNKYLSPTILRLPKSKLLKLFQGWQKGDGWFTQKEICFGTSSKKLAEQSWYILRSLGFKARFQKVKGNKFSQNPSYRIRIGHKTSRFNFLNNMINGEAIFWVTIHNLEDRNFEGEVYDIFIDKPSLYTTSVGIVHNSDFHDFDLWESDQIGIESRPWGVAAADQLYNPDARSLNSMDSDIRSMFTQLGFGNINVSVQEMRGFNRPSTIDMSFDHDRSKYVNPIAKYDY